MKSQSLMKPWLIHWGESPVTRYTFYIAPIAIVLSIPIFVAFVQGQIDRENNMHHTIAGTDDRRFWITIEAGWISLWICKAIASLLPAVFPCPKPPPNRELEILGPNCRYEISSVSMHSGMSPQNIQDEDEGAGNHRNVLSHAKFAWIFGRVATSVSILLWVITLKLLVALVRCMPTIGARTNILNRSSTPTPIGK